MPRGNTGIQGGAGKAAHCLGLETLKQRAERHSCEKRETNSVAEQNLERGYGRREPAKLFLPTAPDLSPLPPSTNGQGGRYCGLPVNGLKDQRKNVLQSRNWENCSVRLSRGAELKGVRGSGLLKRVPVWEGGGNLKESF